jgi:phosphopentomutase
MINLIDFDMLYGHRNDAVGYARALEKFDRELPTIISHLAEKDLLILTADHGCDPTTPSTDHSREYVPLLVYGSGIKSAVDLGIRSSFSDIAQTIAEIFGVERFLTGDSFLHQIL